MASLRTLLLGLERAAETVEHDPESPRIPVPAEGWIWGLLAPYVVAEGVVGIVAPRGGESARACVLAAARAFIDDPSCGSGLHVITETPAEDLANQLVWGRGHYPSWAVAEEVPAAVANVAIDQARGAGDAAVGLVRQPPRFGVPYVRVVHVRLPKMRMLPALVESAASTSACTVLILEADGPNVVELGDALWDLTAVATISADGDQVAVGTPLSPYRTFSGALFERHAGRWVAVGPRSKWH